MRVGIIDSGLGGLAVAKYLKKDGHDIFLIMDQEAFPYGLKSKIYLCKRAFILCQYLIQRKVDVIVIACNTLSIFALPFLKHNISFPIIGVFDYLKPYLTKENLLIGSKNTISYAKKNFPVGTLDGTLLIEAIERRRDYKKIIKEYDFKNYKMLILGCTHFLMLDVNDFLIPVQNQMEELRKDLLSIEMVLQK